MQFKKPSFYGVLLCVVTFISWNFETLIIPLVSKAVVCIHLFYCRMNAPPYDVINFNDYVNEYVAAKHERCDALYPHGGARDKSTDKNDDDILSSPASSYSSLYVQ